MSFFGGVGRMTRSGFDRIISARERQVRRYVNGALLQLDDETLKRAGYSRVDLERQGSAYYPL